jgi:hypothetical protein
MIAPYVGCIGTMNAKPEPSGSSAASGVANTLRWSRSPTCFFVSCIYVPITQSGKVVDGQGFGLDLEDE